MYCINDTLYLEESASNSWNISELSQNDTFCKGVYTFIRYTSAPLGLAIIFINILAFKAISNVMRSHLSFGGNAVTLKGITFFDVMNGCFLLIYFVETAMGSFLKGSGGSGKYFWKAEVWCSWLCIYSSVLFRLYLCCQRLYSYGMLLVTAQNTHLIPESRRKSYKVCCGLFIVANIELATVLLTKHPWYNFFKDKGMYTIPFLLIQDVAVVLVSLLSIVVLVSSTSRSYSNLLVSSAVLPLCLISVSSVITNLATFYGDVLCLSRSIEVTNHFLLTMKPECFIPLAKALTYFDSLFFPIILFYTSANLRKSLAQVVCGVQPVSQPLVQ